MDLHGASEADKYLLYGLLLRKRRSRSRERRVVSIIHSSLPLEERIEALLGLQAEEDRALSPLAAARWPQAAGSADHRRSGGLVVDVHPEVARLLRTCGLKRRLAFQRIGESFEAVYLIRRLGVRLIVVNEQLPAEDYARYYEVCRIIEPRIRMIFLCAPPPGLAGGELFRRNTRFLPKPINIEKLETTAAELLSAEPAIRRTGPSAAGGSRGRAGSP